MLPIHGSCRKPVLQRNLYAAWTVDEPHVIYMFKYSRNLIWQTILFLLHGERTWQMINNIGVVGSGIMGRGIALIYALHGYKVFLYDCEPKALAEAGRRIEKDLALLVAEGLVTQNQQAQALVNIDFTDSLSAAVSGADFVIEAVPEQLPLKQQLFSEIEKLVMDDTILASNTSTLPLADLARYLSRPERMIITHFFNPAHLVPLVEVVTSENTPGNVLTSTLDLLKHLNKKPVVLKKTVPGFIANRLQAALFREALHLVSIGVADCKDIDTAVTAGPGFRWSLIGPMETADFGGLDTWQKVMNNLCPELDCTRSSPELIDVMNEEGRLGVKSGEGFYSYPDEEAIAEKIRSRDLNFIRLLKISQEQTNS